ncbi:MAG TPA: hypothetical protein VHR47_04600 [Bacillota bacterium]|nr:hypothetical protein [Bacillota bacterium]
MNTNNRYLTDETPDFKKLTPINGFDVDNPDNAMQNSYAWSMGELGDYLYVGTGRNLAYQMYQGLQMAFGLPIPSIFIPERMNMNPEIWRYKKDGSEPWRKVYQTPPDLGLSGLRYMIRYTTPTGETALYAGSFKTGQPGVYLFKTEDGLNWRPLNPAIMSGNSTRSIVNHQGKLYMSVIKSDQDMSGAYLYESEDPERDGWRQIDLDGTPGQNPSGGITTMLSYNSRLYLAVASPDGFELWRSIGTVPAKDQWKLVVDRGAGDAANQVPLTIGLFKDRIYVGTAIISGVASIDPNRRFSLPKGFDLVRVNRDDQWEVVIGGPPIIPTQPTTGTRSDPLSGQPSGFGNLFNAYCWQLRPYREQLYLGTFDMGVSYPPLLQSLADKYQSQIPYNLQNYGNLLEAYIKFLYRDNGLFQMLPWGQFGGNFLQKFTESFGFDLWRSTEGLIWTPVSLDGLGNPYNYGARNLYVTDENRLYLGTANPFQGCEVWTDSCI